MAKRKMPLNPPLEKGEALKLIRERAAKFLLSIAYCNGIMERRRAKYEAQCGRLKKMDTND